MKLLEVFSKEGVPDRYRFVFDAVDQVGLNAVLAMSEDGSQGTWVKEQYEPGSSNEHLGHSVPLSALGDVALNGFFSWLAIPTEYGREDV